ncbi:MAG: glutamine amidotransferase [Candidatus Saccharimonadales bacterium]
MELRIAHLYPQNMNIYGDWGNIIALEKRLEWRGYKAKYEAIELGDEYDFTQADIVFGGGGQDKGQLIVAKDLQRHKNNINKAVEEGVVFLLICGLYQLFGNRFTTSIGEELQGVGVFDAETVGSEDRMIGNITLQTSWGELVGFENHSGKTILNPGQSALGRVTKGYGNNGSDGFEGAISNNSFGTYLHGSLLPKNPKFADELIKRALARKGDLTHLEPLNDSLAVRAATVAKSRP